jgi:hypothetical protein
MTTMTHSMHIIKFIKGIIYVRHTNKWYLNLVGYINFEKNKVWSKKKANLQKYKNQLKNVRIRLIECELGLVNFLYDLFFYDFMK